MNGGVCYTQVRKVLGKPPGTSAVLGPASVLWRKWGSVERQGVAVLRKGNVGGAELLLRVLWRI